MALRIKRATALAITGAVAAATAVGLTGAVATAATGTTALAGAAGAAAGPAVAGTEHFQVITASTTPTRASVILDGAFAAGGSDHISTSDASTSADVFVLPGGSFKVVHTGKPGTQNFDFTTCAYSFSQPGTYKLAGGTGKYKGISGHGSYTVSGLGISPRLKNGKCNPDAPAVAQQIVFRGSGPVRLR